MTYTFHRCQPHPRCPDLTGWYLELRPHDFAAQIEVNLAVAGLNATKFGLDPHLQGNTVYSPLYNPVRLTAAWQHSVERFLLAGEAVLVNSNGGFMSRDGVIILETKECDDLRWPCHYDDEVITIRRWPRGRHWYLSSNKNRIFSPGKYNSVKAARRAAEHYTPADRIRVNECSAPLPPE